MVNLNFLLHCPPAAYLYPVGVWWYMSIGELPKFPRCMLPLCNLCWKFTWGGGGGGRYDQKKINVQKLHFCVP